MEDVTVSAVAVTTTSDQHATARFFLSGRTERDVTLPTDARVRSEPGLEFARSGFSRRGGMLHHNYTTAPSDGD